jgi:hypothetical protein
MSSEVRADLSGPPIASRRDEQRLVESVKRCVRGVDQLLDIPEELQEGIATRTPRTSSFPRTRRNKELYGGRADLPTEPFRLNLNDES